MSVMAAPPTSSMAVRSPERAEISIPCFIRLPRHETGILRAQMWLRTLAAQLSVLPRSRVNSLTRCQRREEAASRSHTGCRNRRPDLGPAGPGGCETWRTPLQGSIESVRQSLTKRLSRSCENLQQQALVSPFDGTDPFGFVD